MLRDIRAYVGHLQARFMWLVLVIVFVQFLGVVIGYAVQDTLSLGDIRAYATVSGVIGMIGLAIALWSAALARHITGRDNAITGWLERG